MYEIKILFATVFYKELIFVNPLYCQQQVKHILDLLQLLLPSSIHYYSTTGMEHRLQYLI